MLAEQFLCGGSIGNLASISAASPYCKSLIMHVKQRLDGAVKLGTACSDHFSREHSTYKMPFCDAASHA
jgi:hypothetical protein